MQYNKVSQIIGRTLSDEGYEYAYFEPEVPVTSLVTNYQSNGLNQYDTVGGQTILYDGNGNLTDDGTWQFFYDAENRLVRAYNVGTVKATEYQYDPKGRRIRKTVDADSVTPVVTEYVYEGDEPIADYDGAGNVLRRYMHGANVDERMMYKEYATNGTQTKMYMYQADNLGNIISLTNYAGDQVTRYTYDAYGVPGEAEDGQPFRYTGRRYDPETGLYYYRALL